jgi:peptide-methionine (S)-S-oxide reductase
MPAPAFYFAEDYHQQYLAKNPGGYCGLKGTGVSCASAAHASDAAE